jgi:opacity protein-like surface antigen
VGFKPYLGSVLAALLVCATSPLVAQTVHAATGLRVHTGFSVGAGISDYNNPDFGHGHLLGGTLWIDYTLPHMPHLLQGIGLEAKGLDLNYGRSATLPANLREDVASGGVIYSLPRYRNFRPFAKLMLGYGNVDEENSNSTPPVRWHDSRTVTSGGGGFDYRVYRSVWMRVDYEYQSWPDFFKHPGGVPPAGKLNPQGFTVGAIYHFNHPHIH